MSRSPEHSPEEMAQALALHGSQRAAARALGVPKSTFNERLSKLDPAILQGMQALGIESVPSTVWIKTNPTDAAPGYSFMLRPEDDDRVQQIREAVEGLTPAEPAPQPPYSIDDLLTAYLIADAHIGLLAWREEAGADYDTKIATKRLVDWVGQAVHASPAASTGLILALGDTLHANDVTGMTPANRHVLDVDGRHFRVMDMTVVALGAAIDCALRKHERVIVRILPGNHDRDAYIALMFSMVERYRNEPRVEVQKVPGEHFVYQHGKVMLAAHHGHGAKPPQLVHWMAAEHPKIWGDTEHRYLFTGHLHHLRAQDIGGVEHEQLRALAEKDAWAAGKSFTSRAQLQAITYDRERGEVRRVKVKA